VNPHPIPTAPASHNLACSPEGLIERSEFEPPIAGFRQRIGGWDGQIKAMRDEAALRSTLSLVIGRLEDFAKRVHDRMSEVDWLLQRDLIRTLVKRVEIDQHDVNVVFRVDGTLPTPDPASPGQNSFWQDCGRVDHPALRRSCYAGHHAPVLHLGRSLQPALDIEEHPSTARMFADRFEQQLPVDAVERGPQLIPPSRTRRLGM
jgi:site-specific DNA recombinase